MQVKRRVETGSLVSYCAGDSMDDRYYWSITAYRVAGHHSGILKLSVCRIMSQNIKTTRLICIHQTVITGPRILFTTGKQSGKHLMSCSNAHCECPLYEPFYFHQLIARMSWVKLLGVMVYPFCITFHPVSVPSWSTRLPPQSTNMQV